MTNCILYADRFPAGPELGDIVVAVDENGALVYLSFRDPVTTANDPDAQTADTEALRQAVSRPGETIEWNPAACAAVRAELTAYLAGTLRAFTVPVAPRGTPFQQAVWNELRAIPHGETTTYGELARRLNHPNAARAVGAANGANRIAIVIPCHRVIAANGTLHGFAFGLPRKRHLLDLETQTLTLR